MNLFKKIAIITVIILGLISCREKSSNNQLQGQEKGTVQNSNTHTHADGTVHSDHAPEQDLSQQESFKVEADSVTVVHDHDHDHDHSDPNHTH